MTNLIITVFDDGSLDIETLDQKKGHTYESIGTFFRAIIKSQKFYEAILAKKIKFYVNTRYLSRGRDSFVLNNLESMMDATIPSDCRISWK